MIEDYDDSNNNTNNAAKIIIINLISLINEVSINNGANNTNTNEIRPNVMYKE